MLVVGATLALLPWLVCHTDLRQSVLRSALGKFHLTGDCDKLRAGWFTPISLHGLTAKSMQGITIFEVASIQSSVTLASMVFGHTNLGEFQITDSVLHLYVGKGATTWELLREIQKQRDTKSEHTSTPTASSPVSIKLHLKNAQLVVHEYNDKTTLADVSNVNLVAAISTESGEPQLTIQLSEPLTRIPVTPELSRAGLRYATPVLSVATWTSGTFSVELETFVVPLRAPKNARIKGAIVLHDVTAGLQEGPVRSATRDIAMLTNRRIPDKITLAKESRVEFAAYDGRVHHSGLAVGLPDVSSELLVHSSGSVGFDKTLQLELDVPLPFALLGTGPLAKTLGNQSLLLPVSGTLDDPTISFQGDGKIVSDLLAKLLTGGQVPTTEKSGNSDSPDSDDTLQEFLDQAGEVAKLLKQRRDERRKQQPPTSDEGQEPTSRPLRDFLDRLRQ
ncbi:MAG: hypothetical protein O3C60_12935 [Planctomycetota bacterium]|nr:hypothetical protein [Planctomycetota bacterium]